MRVIPDRWEQILDLVESAKSASVKQIAESVSTSEATVRRDLVQMEKRGLLQRFWGGAAPSTQCRTVPTLAESRQIHPQEKTLIGRVAAELIVDGDAVIIDGGFTTYQVARHLRAKKVYVATNSLDVAQVLVERKEMTVVMIGGDVIPSSGTAVGPTTSHQIAQLCANKVILGADAICPVRGLSTPNPAICQTKRMMIERSRQVIVVADHCKLNRFMLHHVAGIDAVDILVTDDKAEPSAVHQFEKAGVDVVVATAQGRESDGRSARRVRASSL